MPKTIKIQDRLVGPGQRVFLSAEVGTTCNGSLNEAKEIIQAAKEAKMDAVKFQILDPEKKFSDHSMTYSYTRYDGSQARNADAVRRKRTAGVPARQIPPDSWQLFSRCTRAGSRRGGTGQR